jgi:hypothetical protein
MGEGRIRFAGGVLQNGGSKATAKILHYPQLDTVLMVEEFIREHSGEFRKRQLWEHLPKKMMYQTFCVIMDYLESSGKTAMDREGKIGWIWDPEGVRRYLKKKHLAWRK